MKELYLMRHAKSDWNGYYVSDFERTLNKRGRHAAPLMGKVLHAMGVAPDLILSSPATRAAMTAEAVAQELGYPAEAIRYEPKIYEASLSDLMEIIHALPDGASRVMIVGHNPAMTALINRLSDLEPENLPTAGVVGIRFDVDRFSRIEPHSGEVRFYEYPKKHKGEG